MTYEMQLKCDGCGMPKKETNHWLCIARINDHPGQPLGVMWLSEVAPEDLAGMTHYCGRTCVWQAISKVLDETEVAGIGHP